MALHTNEVDVSDHDTIYKNAKGQLTNLKRKCRQVHAAIAVTDTAIRDIVQIANMCKQVRDIYVASRDRPGFQTFIRNAEEDPTYDHPASVDQAVAAIDPLVAWIFANLPMNRAAGRFNNAVFDYRLNADGSSTALTVTPTQATTLPTPATSLQAQLAAFLASVT